MSKLTKKQLEERREKIVIKKRTASKRIAIYSLQKNLNRLKLRIRHDLLRCDKEKDRLTALVIRIMMKTSERVGNEGSAKAGHFGVTMFKPKHIKVEGNVVHLDYKGKSGVDHDKQFADETSAEILKQLLHQNRHKQYLFTTSDGFRIMPTRVNRYLKKYSAKSKDIRGFNSNRMMVKKLESKGKIKEEKMRPRVFNESLRAIAKKIGHGSGTLRKHYLLPELEENFYRTGTVGNINIE